MSQTKDVICRLCLKVPYNEFTLIDETAREVLDVLSVKMKFDVSNDPMMCEDCTDTLKRSLSFMSVCMDSEETILFFDTNEKVRKTNIDLKSLYAHISKEIVDVNSDVCRFCIKKVEEKEFSLLDDLMKENTFLDMLKECMFQMDLRSTSNPIVCFRCRDNMESYFKFLLNCRDTEEKINIYRQNEGIRGEEKILLSKVCRQFFKHPLEYSERYMQVCEMIREQHSNKEITEIQFTGKCNSTEQAIKYVIKDEKINNSQKDGSCLEYRTRSNKTSPITEHKRIETVCSEMNGVLKIESEELEIKDEVTLSEVTHSPREYTIFRCGKAKILMYKCRTCGFKTQQRAGLKDHLLTHKPEAELAMYKCLSCGHRTLYNCDFRKHLLTHMTQEEVTLHKCTVCDFKTIHRSNINRHYLTHKTEAEVEIYKCTVCTFQTKHMSALKGHSLAHNTEAVLKVNKCRVCDFRTKHKCALRRHYLTHKAEAEVTMYKCEACDFQTRHKRSLGGHLLTHKAKGGVAMFRCSDCDYKTIFKGNLRRHVLSHKPKVNVTVYKCATCDFKTKCKNSLRTHHLMHKPESELKMYKCMTCDFKTKYKSNLNEHFLTHKTKEEVTMHKCSTCDFMTRRKNNLKVHELIHKPKSEVRMHKCTACDYETKFKQSLISHSLVHKTEAEVTMYKCTTRNLKTKHKQCTHARTHKVKVKEIAIYDIVEMIWCMVYNRDGPR